MSKPEPDFDPDRLMNALKTRTAEEWGACAIGLKGGDMRMNALHDAIMDVYRAQNPLEEAFERI
ncbi:hypothetical protein D3C78_1523180 [compost metagenome]